MLAEHVEHGRGQLGELRGVEQRDPLDAVAEEAGQPAGEVAADHHVVRRGAADVEHGLAHESSSSRSLISAATS